jgi:hypothetical protein
MTWKQPLSMCLLVLAACAAPKIGYDYDRAADFSSYRTYEWMPGNQEKTGNRRVDNSQVDIRIRTAVGAQLRVKGYAPAAGRPDFYVAYYVGLNHMAPDVSTEYFTRGMTGAPFVHSADTRPSGGADAKGKDAPSDLTGTLLIDVIDAATNKLVWRGTAAGTVDPGLTAQERDERIRTVVRNVLSNFPPK